MQEMTYAEREQLKHFDFGDQAGEVLIMIAHWHRQPVRIKFTDYASNWAAAQTRRKVSRLREAWPLAGERMISDDCSDWNSKTKQCPACGQLLPLESFYSDRSRADGLETYCWKCSNARRSRWRQNNPDKARLSSKAQRKKKQKMREYDRKRNRKLPDGYVAKMLCRGAHLVPADVPKALIEAKRETIMIKRLVKEAK